MENIVVVFWLVFGQANIPVPYTHENDCLKAAEILNTSIGAGVACIEMPASDITLFAAQFANVKNRIVY